jgi:hypothetical protein
LTARVVCSVTDLSKSHGFACPVYLEFPRDMVAAEVEPVVALPPRHADAGALAECADEILECIEAAAAPVASWGLSAWSGNERIADSIKKGPPGREREEAAFPIRARDKPTVSPSGRSFATSTRATAARLCQAQAVERFPAEISSPTTKTP